MDDADRRAVIRAVVLAGAGLTFVGAFLPWVVASTLGVSVSRSGIEADGTATLVLAAVAIANVAFRHRDRFAMAIVGACGAGIVAVGSLYVLDLTYGYDIVSMGGVIEEVGSGIADPGIGVYLTLLGGIFVLGGGIASLSGRGDRQSRGG